jgi:hypothetical protein
METPEKPETYDPGFLVHLAAGPLLRAPSAGGHWAARRAA